MNGRLPTTGNTTTVTSLPGVFAAGDVRYGSIKRVAGAAGEGAVTVGSVHQYLLQQGAGARDG